MGDDSRKLLKLFGVAVTEFDAEAERLSTQAAQLSAEAPREQVLAMLKDTADRCRELNQRWLEITRHVFERQDRFLAAIAEAAGRPSE